MLGTLMLIGLGITMTESRPQVTCSSSVEQQLAGEAKSNPALHCPQQTLSSATQEAIWMKQLVSSILQERSEKPIVVYEDNKSAICMTKHQQFHGRSKHIDIRHHFVREKVAANEVEVCYCKSVDMIADILTKPLSAPKFNKLKSMLGMVLEPVEGECR